MKSKRTFICLGLLVLLSTISPGQKLSRLLDYIPFRLTEQISILPSPGLSYSPETNWSFGLTTIGTFRSLVVPGAPLSTIQFDLRYTLNKQLIADLDYHWNSSDQKFSAFGSNSFYSYPDLYFSNLDKSSTELIRYKKTEFDNKFFFNLIESWKGGIIHRIQIINTPESSQDGLFLAEMPTGYLGGISHGIGIGILQDKRNNTLNPANGSSLINVNISIFNDIIGSDYQFTRAELDLRRYLSVFGTQTLAIQAKGIFNTGNPPFSLSGNLGGQSILRGYHKNMFIARQMIALQAELRITVYKRIGIVAFAGLGTVSNRIASLTNKMPNSALGTGIRILLDKTNNANLRFDAAYGSGGLQYYFSYGEAF